MHKQSQNWFGGSTSLISVLFMITHLKTHNSYQKVSALTVLNELVLKKALLLMKTLARDNILFKINLSHLSRSITSRCTKCFSSGKKKGLVLTTTLPALTPLDQSPCKGQNPDPAGVPNILVPLPYNMTSI